MWWILIILIILIILYFYFQKPTTRRRRRRYEDVFGHSRRHIEEIMADETDPFVLGEIYNFNLNQPEIAAEYYEQALQQAIMNSIQEPERVVDRLFPDTFIPVREVGPDYFNRNIRNDSQNVHDTNVVRQVAEKYKTIEAIVPEKDMNQDTAVIAKLREKCRSAGEKGHLALRVLNSIEGNPSYSTAINGTDYDAIIKVCGRAEEHAGIYDALIENLSHCIEDNEIVCTTGRVANIMDSLTLLDPQAGTPMVTVDIARREILQEAAKFSETLADDYDSETAKEDFANLAREKFPQVDEAILNKLIDEAKHGF